MFKTTDRFFGGAAVLAAWAGSVFLGALGLLHRRDSPHRILLSKFCCQGDALVSLHALAALRRQYPHVHLTVLASRKTEEVYRLSGLCDCVIAINIAGHKGLRELGKSGIFSALGLLRKQGPFDTFVDMDLYYRFSLLSGLLLRAGTRIGYRTSWVRRVALNRSVERHRTQSEAECYFDLFALLGLPLERCQTPLRFEFVDAAKTETRRFLMAKGWDGTSPLVGLVPGSSVNWPAKRWSVARFSQLISGLRDFGKPFFLILGQDFENDLGRYLQNKHPDTVIDLTGKTDFALLTQCLSLCSLFVGNDSGPMHLADMLGIPVVAIFGPTDERKWGPLNDRSHVVSSKSVDCRPCYYLSRMPNCTHLRCLSTIEVPDVLSVCGQVLLQKP